MTDKEHDRDFAWWFRESMKVATVGAGIIAAWWLARKQQAGGWLWQLFGR